MEELAQSQGIQNTPDFSFRLLLVQKNKVDFLEYAQGYHLFIFAVI